MAEKPEAATLESIREDVTKIGDSATAVAERLTKDNDTLKREVAELRSTITERRGLPHSQTEAGRNAKFEWRRLLSCREHQRTGNVGDKIWLRRIDGRGCELERDVMLEAKRKFAFLREVNGADGGTEVDLGEATTGDRGLVTTTDSSGGFLVPDEIGGYTDILRARTPLGKLGWEIIPTRAQPYRYNRMSTGATMTALSEGAALTESTVAFQGLQYWPKKYGTYVVVSSEMLREADPSIESIVNNELLQRAAINAQTQYLIGSGAAGNPIGVTTAVSAFTTNIDPLLPIGLLAMIEQLKTNNVLGDGSRLGWVMHPFVEGAILAMPAGTVTIGGTTTVYNTGLIPPGASQMQESLPIYGIRYATTTILGGGEGTADLALIDLSMSALLRWGAIEVAMSPHPQFINDNTVIRIADRINVLIRQSVGTVFATAVGKAS